jgi:putative FmdB family regulatory protein
MPTYEYECQSCHERHEAVQRFADAPLTTCPRCGGDLRRVFSSVGIVFKGSGFYKNDSRPSATSAAGAAPSTPPSKEKVPSAAGATPESAASSPAPSASAASAD